jgi:signal transduction histidine kinase
MSPIESSVATLIHDLRQPLGNIESSAWCLSSLTQNSDPRIREQIRLIQRQIEAAENILTAASADLARSRACHIEEPAAFAATNAR